MTHPARSTNRHAIAYFRVSSQQQGRSGLGLEAQESAVRACAAGRGLHIVRTFTEVETATGKRRRPQLEAALEVARRENAVLLIAKLDRLARQVSFISALMESGVDFIAADMPEADKLTLHVLSAVGEAEARFISDRTKAALAARKARGLPLGNPSNFPPEVRALGGAARRAKALKDQRQAEGLVEARRAAGQTLRAIAAELEAREFPTVNGGRWTAAQVRRILLRAQEARQQVSPAVPF